MLTLAKIKGLIRFCFRSFFFRTCGILSSLSGLSFSFSKPKRLIRFSFKRGKKKGRAIRKSKVMSNELHFSY